jgi:hypothetical protein
MFAFVSFGVSTSLSLIRVDEGFMLARDLQQPWRVQLSPGLHRHALQPGHLRGRVSILVGGGFRRFVF